MSNIFTAPGSPQRPANERNNLATPERAVPPLLPSGPSAWLYFNLLITQSQVGDVGSEGWPVGLSSCTGWPSPRPALCRRGA